MSLTCYTMDDLRLGRGGFLRKGWTIQQFPELEEALAHYRGIPITKRKVLGMTDGFHVLELVKNVPLLPDDPEGEDVLASELGEPLPAWADTPETRRAVRICVEALELRYQIEDKILAPIPVNKKQRRKKLAGKYLWPDVPGNPASALRWVYLAGRGWLAPSALKESAAWCSKCGRTASRTKATTAPWSWSPGSSASWPGAPWSGWSRTRRKPTKKEEPHRETYHSEMCRRSAHGRGAAPHRPGGGARPRSGGGAGLLSNFRRPK